MKKLFSLIITLAILGAIGFYFLGNNMLIISALSNNAEKLLVSYNNAMNDFAEAEWYDFVYEETITDDGVTKYVTKTNVLLGLTDTTINYYIYLEDYDDDGDVESTKQFYFDDTISAGTLYMKQTVGTTITKTGTEMTSESDISNSIYLNTTNNSMFSLFLSAYFDYANTGKEIADFNTPEADTPGNYKGASLAFQFSNWFIGVNLVWSQAAVEPAFTDMAFGIDLFGNLKHTEIKNAENTTNYNSYIMNINSYNEALTIPTLTETEMADYVIA